MCHSSNHWLLSNSPSVAALEVHVDNVISHLWFPETGLDSIVGCEGIGILSLNPYPGVV